MAKKKDNSKEISTGDLKEKLSTLQEKLRMFRFNQQGTKNVKEQANLKKEIARLLTATNKNK